MRRVRRAHVLTVVAASVAMSLTPVMPSFATAPAPPAVRDALVEGLPTLSEHASEGGVAAANRDLGVERTPELDGDIPFNMIGFALPEGVDAVDVRTRRVDGTWSDWYRLEVLDPELDGPDPGSAEAREASTTATAPLWVGEADGFQVHAPTGTLEQITASLIDATGLSEPRLTRLARLLSPRPVVAEAATAGRPALVTRAQWGADETRVKQAPSYAATVQFGVVHHTAGSNTYTREQAPAIVNGIYHYHTAPKPHGNGWNDIGYNALVDRFGTIYEGRAGGLERAVVGAHAANYNTGSFGVSVLGNFDVEDIPAVAVESVARITAWKYAIHRVDAGRWATFTRADGQVLPVTVGHRDVGATACPGRYFYARFGSLRERIAALAPQFDQGVLVTGDWNGDGRSTPGWFYRGTFYLRDVNSTGPAHRVVRFGAAGDHPVVGDWNGDGRTGLGYVRDGTWYLRDTATSGLPDHQFVYGRLAAGDLPLAGDWNADGRDTVGIVRAGGEWHLRNSLTAGPANLMFKYGRVEGGDVPVTGDWIGDGRSTVGIVRGDHWMLRYTNTGGNADRVLRFGRPGDVPLTGDWSGDGRQTIGVVRGQLWYLKDTVDPGPADRTFRY
jgi:hypothetical protein